MTDKQFTNYTVSQIYSLIRSKPYLFVFSKIRDCLGDCDKIEEQIRIDPFNIRTNIVSVFIHECLHWFHWNWPERRVLKYEKKIMKNLSKSQIKRLNGRITSLM